jgi:hypothetical protein
MALTRQEGGLQSYDETWLLTALKSEKFVNPVKWGASRNLRGSKKNAFFFVPQICL